MYPTEQAAIREIRSHLNGQFRHKAHIYFTDAAVSILVGYFFAFLYLSPAAGVWTQWVFFLIAGFALFRAGLFMHEIVHMPNGKMKPFKVFWNIVYGVPLGGHSFLYTCHLYHHQTKTFGTENDGEYLPLGRGNRWRLFFYIMEVPILPFLSLARFTILVPLSLVFPAIRTWLIRHASSAVMNPRFKFDKPHMYNRWWRLCDIASSTWIWCVVGLTASGVIPWQIILKVYFLIVLVVGINWLRNLVAHTYTNQGDRISHLRQFLDSINISGPFPLVNLFFPIGMRYHALHHLLPSLPYHEMRHVHQKLKTELPADSPYLAQTDLALGVALKKLVTRTGGTARWEAIG